MQRDARFWNRMAARYSRTAIGDEAAYEKKLAMTRALFSPATRVLEVGCGTGSTAVLHAPHVQHLHATDFSDRMIEIARQRAAEARLENMSFEVAPLEEIRGDGQRFDVILALNVLHLVRDVDVALTRLVPLLAPGGALVASTACIRDSLPAMRFVLPAARAIGLVPNVNIFTEAEFTAALAQAGLEIEQRYQPEAGRAPAVFHIARLAAR